MVTRGFPRPVVLTYVAAAMGTALAWLGCGPEPSELTAPTSRAPSLSQLGPSLGQGFVSIDYPGATSTVAVGISASGEIVGIYRGPDGKPHGFLLFGGAFTPLPDVPAALETDWAKVNADGTISGFYRDAVSEHAFVFRNGTFKAINFPDPSISLTGWGLDDAGDVVGVKFVEGDFFHGHGYVFSKNAFTIFDFPGAIATFALGIADGGSIVGTYINPDFSFHGFLLSKGAFSTTDFPNSGFDWVSDINSLGEIVGFYGGHGMEHGFVKSNGTFKSFDPAGSVDTQGLAINPQGDVVGWYRLSDGGQHGFFLACATCSLR